MRSRGSGPGRAGALAAFLAAFLIAAPASAHPGEGVHLHAWAEAGPRLLDDGLWLGLDPAVALVAPGVEVTLGPPLNLGTGDGGPGLRTEDWDAPADWGRLLRRLSLQVGTARLEAGPLTGVTLGHGTLVSGYVARWDPDLWRTAAQVGWRGAAVQVEALAGALLAPGPYAVRLAAAPGAPWGAPLGTGPEVGLTVVADPEAPQVPGAAGPRRGMAAAGLDLGWVVWRDQAVALSPYLDGVLAVAGPAAGKGALHLGVLVDLGPSSTPWGTVRAEARRVGRGWTPEYLDAFYALEREAGLAGGPPRAAAGAEATAWGGLLVVALARGPVRARLQGDAGAEGLERLTLGLDWAGDRLALWSFLGWRRPAEGGALSPEAFLVSTEARWSVTDALWLSGRAAWVRRAEGAGWRGVPVVGLAVGVGG